VTTPDQFSFDYALRNACAEFSADCYDEFARLARLIHARPGKFQLLVIDCRSEILRDRVIGKLNEMLAIAGRVSERLALTRDAYADFAAVESALSTLSGKADVIHVTGGAVWFDAVSWESFNIRREGEGEYSALARCGISSGNGRYCDRSLGVARISHYI